MKWHLSNDRTQGYMYMLRSDNISKGRTQVKLHVHIVYVKEWHYFQSQVKLHVHIVYVKDWHYIQWEDASKVTCTHIIIKYLYSYTHKNIKYLNAVYIDLH